MDRDTKERILEPALALFAQDGYRELISLYGILHEADVQKL